MNKTRWQKAKKFIIDFYQETSRPGEEAKARFEQVYREIEESYIYTYL